MFKKKLDQVCWCSKSRSRQSDKLECQSYSASTIFKSEYKMHAGSIHATEYRNNLQYIFFQILMFWIFVMLDVLIRDCILRYIELWLEATEYKGLFGRAPRAASRLNLVGALPNIFLLKWFYTDSMISGQFSRAPRAASGLSPVGAMPNSFLLRSDSMLILWSDSLKWAEALPKRPNSRKENMSMTKFAVYKSFEPYILWDLNQPSQ